MEGKHYLKGGSRLWHKAWRACSEWRIYEATWKRLGYLLLYSDTHWKKEILYIIVQNQFPKRYASISKHLFVYILLNNVQWQALSAVHWQTLWHEISIFQKWISHFQEGLLPHQGKVFSNLERDWLFFLLGVIHLDTSVDQNYCTKTQEEVVSIQ